MAKKQNERERNRERERKARGSRKYGQAKLKHAKRGIASCTIAGTVGVLMISMLAVAYISAGNAGRYIGGIGLVSMLLTGVGICNGFKGFKEREKNYLTCKIGAGFNILFLLGFVAIFCRGLF